MTENEGTYSRLIEVERKRAAPAAAPSPAQPRKEAKPAAPPEDLATTPYISQNYRFTEDELRWLRRQAYSLTERFGTKVSQNAILRVALGLLREACGKNPRQNSLTEAISKLKK
jgi:hypothetical protein